MANLARGFAARGNEVDLLTADAGGPFRALLPEAVRVVELGRRGVASCLPGLARYLRRERPAVLLAAMTHANVIALLARRIAGARTRLVVSEHSSFVQVGMAYRNWRDRLLRFLARRLYRRADAVVVVARGIVDEMRDLLGVAASRVHVVPNPVVTEELLARSRAEPPCEAFGKGVPVILGAGRLSAEKDFETLLRAFARLRADRPARLVIVGEGPERAALERLAGELGIGDDLFLPGFVDNPYAYMRAASLFVLSSRFEGMPGVLIEAMACGTPVVSTDCPLGPGELLEGGRWGRLAPVGDPAGLAAAMAATLDNETPPDIRSRAALFTEQSSVDRYLDILLAGQD